MRVLIDARMVTPKLHGFARYVSLLAEGLAEIGRERTLGYVPIFLVNRRLPNPIPPVFETVACDAEFLSPREMIEIPRAIRKAGASLYHSPTFSSLPKCPVPWIVTIHDLNHLIYGTLKQKMYYELVLKRFARGARATLTVSEYSRREIAAWSGLPADQIEVVYNAIAPAWRKRPADAETPATLARLGLKRGEYFFCLSNPKPHKNVPLLLDAYEQFRRQHPGAWPLVLSMDPMREGDGLRWLGSLEEKDTRALLLSAGAMTFPSEYEGFGLPPVEAACQGGIPLLVSKIEPHREALRDVPEDEVCWLPPGDCTAWERALGKVMAGQVPGVSVSARDRVRARYSVLNLGAHMDRIYTRVLGVLP